MKKALALSLALLLVLALFTGCQKADPAPSDTAPSTNAQTPADSSNTASSEEPYYVAMHIPLTGDASQYGGYISNGFMVAIDECNENGGINGRKIQVDIFDDKSDSAEASTIGTKIAEDDKYIAVVGSYTCADLADIVAVDAKPAKEEAEQECCHPVLRFGRNLRRDIVLYFLTVQNLLHGFRHGVDIGATLRCKADCRTLEALAQCTVLINAHTTNRHLGLRNDWLDPDVCAVLEEKPETNVHIRFFLERDALPGNAALDLERHLERCLAGIELLHDLFQCGGIGKIKFTGTGRECDVFHAAGKVIHNVFSFLKSGGWLIRIVF